MGIQGLNKLLKELAPSAFRRIRISEFDGKRIPIDGNLWTWKYMALSFKRIVLDQSLVSDSDLSLDLCQKIKPLVRSHLTTVIDSCLLTFETHKIRPIFVFDGIAVPEKSEFARIRRQQSTQSQKDRISRLLEARESVDVLLRTSEMSSEIRKTLSNLPQVDKNDLSFVQNYLSEKNVRIHIAPDEAEKECVVIHRRMPSEFPAVWTSDTDSYALGAKIVISGYHETSNVHFETVILPEILQILGMSQRDFTDMCIAIGCDFNCRMKGYGPKKVYAMFKEFGNLENIMKSEKYKSLPWEEIKIERCREIFTI